MMSADTQQPVSPAPTSGAAGSARSEKDAESIPPTGHAPGPVSSGSVKRHTGKNPYKALLKGVVVFLTLLGVIILTRVMDFSHLDTQWMDINIRRQGFQGIMLFIGLCAVTSALGFPRQALSFLGGYAFGAELGMLYATLGTTTGCALGFFYARLIGRSFITRLFSGRVARINNVLSRAPFTMALMIRFMPVGSNAITNLVGGITSIPAFGFIAGSFVGYIPQNLVFSILGSGMRVETFWRVFLSASLFIISTALGWILYRRHKASLQPEDPEQKV